MALLLLNSLLLAVLTGLSPRTDLLRPARAHFGVPTAQARTYPSPDPAPFGAGHEPPRKIHPESLGVKVTAPSAALIDTRTGNILFSQGHDRIVPIASITKLMTALVVLDTDPDWQARVTVTAEDVAVEGLPYFKAGESMTVRDAFQSAMTGSVNSAAMALARSTGLSSADFVSRMNSKARFLGLTYTKFVDPTGYAPENVSTSLDVARLAFHAIDRQEIRDALTMKEARFKTTQGLEKIIPATNQLLSSFLNADGTTIVGGKTGYTEEAGYTLVVRGKKGSGDLIAVVLGSTTSEDRFQDVKSLLTWGFRTFEW
jgi:D-alanyl-D-alanine carboxypeptidase